MQPQNCSSWQLQRIRLSPDLGDNSLVSIKPCLFCWIVIMEYFSFHKLCFKIFYEDPFQIEASKQLCSIGTSNIGGSGRTI